MGLTRSTFYDAPAVKADDVEIVAKITTIRDKFEAYGRRIGAALRHQGFAVNAKKKLTDEFLRKPQILHPWPSVCFAVRHPR